LTENSCRKFQTNAIHKSTHLPTQCLPLTWLIIGVRTGIEFNGDLLQFCRINFGVVEQSRAGGQCYKNQWKCQTVQFIFKAKKIFYVFMEH
jgi:hypothetical protein